MRDWKEPPMLDLASTCRSIECVCYLSNDAQLLLPKLSACFAKKLDKSYSEVKMGECA